MIVEGSTVVVLGYPGALFTALVLRICHYRKVCKSVRLQRQTTELSSRVFVVYPDGYQNDLLLNEIRLPSPDEISDDGSVKQPEDDGLWRR